MNFDDLKVQGIQMQYYYVCPRKLWLFSKQITMEHTNDQVLQGKILHEQAYSREKKEVSIDNLIKLDMISDDYVGEVKSSSRMMEADRMQLLYYLYYLKQLKIERTGKIHYVKERRTEEVYLTTEDEKKVEKALVKIREINSCESPPSKKRLPYCPKCAYYLFCFVGEVEE
nr:CRISPR-associated protein Cas4 [Thermoflavimicrobium daqui]